MKVKDLKEALASLPDDMDVIHAFPGNGFVTPKIEIRNLIFNKIYHFYCVHSRYGHEEEERKALVIS